MKKSQCHYSTLPCQVNDTVILNDNDHPPTSRFWNIYRGTEAGMLLFRKPCHKKYYINATKDKVPFTSWKVSKYGVIPGPYFPTFGLKTERYFVSLCIQSECGKIRTRNNSVFGHFLRSMDCQCCIQNQNDSVQMLWVPKNCPKKVYKSSKNIWTVEIIL